MQTHTQTHTHTHTNVTMQSCIIFHTRNSKRNSTQKRFLYVCVYDFIFLSVSLICDVLCCYVWTKKAIPESYRRSVCLFSFSCVCERFIFYFICMNHLLQTCVVRAWDLSQPLLFAPAMNTFMWEHPLTAQQVDVLKGFGYHEIPCISKKLACGDTGMLSRVLHFTL